MVTGTSIVYGVVGNSVSLPAKKVFLYAGDERKCEVAACWIFSGVLTLVKR